MEFCVSDTNIRLQICGVNGAGLSELWLLGVLVVFQNLQRKPR